MEVGRHAPDFRLETLEQGRFYLNAQQGRVVVLSFWATWCVSCRRELQELETLAKAFSDRPVTLATVLQDPENRDAAYALTEQLSLPVLLDTQAKVTQRYGVTDLPCTVIIDPQGRICLYRVGYDATYAHQVQGVIESLLLRRDEN